MTTQATTIPNAPELANVGTDRENQILNVLLATITPEPTCWTKLVKAVNANVKIRKNGWMAVRNLLQWLIENGFVKRCPFDENKLDESDSYVRLPR
ncbi:hypothetical protein [Pseudomonas atacamensis]|uniref:hypothetical protein n=1 Tax=Pseudomonas atacamensis TaxID=2565368 RepID=UPI0019D26936|nr:hypothetical protein [Pseudomonas atacamensis]QSL90514.1 hypothetical protein JWU58_27125 [Pseudomonas atacamensis]